MQFDINSHTLGQEAYNLAQFEFHESRGDDEKFRWACNLMYKALMYKLHQLLESKDIPYSNNSNLIILLEKLYDTGRVFNSYSDMRSDATKLQDWKSINTTRINFAKSVNLFHRAEQYFKDINTIIQKPETAVIV